MIKTKYTITKKSWSTLLLLFVTLTTFGQQKIETLKISWPEEYNWRIGSNQDTESTNIVELIPGEENAGITATVTCMKGIQYSPMEIVMNDTFNNIRKSAPKATITLNERDKDAKNHWILFKIESIGSKTERVPESRLYYVIQGDYSLYSIFISVKEKSLSPEFVNKWTNIFMKSELVHDTNKFGPSVPSTTGTE